MLVADEILRRLLLAALITLFLCSYRLLQKLGLHLFIFCLQPSFGIFQRFEPERTNRRRLEAA